MQINRVESLAEGFQLAFPLAISSVDGINSSACPNADASLQHRMYMIRVADKSGLNASPASLIQGIKANRLFGGTWTTELGYFTDDGVIGYFEADIVDLKRYYHEVKRKDGKQSRFKGL